MNPLESGHLYSVFTNLYENKRGWRAEKRYYITIKTVELHFFKIHSLYIEYITKFIINTYFYKLICNRLITWSCTKNALFIHLIILNDVSLLQSTLKQLHTIQFNIYTCVLSYNSQIYIAFHSDLEIYIHD